MTALEAARRASEHRIDGLDYSILPLYSFRLIKVMPVDEYVCKFCFVYSFYNLLIEDDNDMHGSIVNRQHVCAGTWPRLCTLSLVCTLCSPRGLLIARLHCQHSKLTGLYVYFSFTSYWVAFSSCFQSL